MNRIFLIFFGLTMFSNHIFADAISNVSVSPYISTDLAPGSTVTLNFRVEITMPFGGTSNACTAWDNSGISISASERVDNASLTFSPSLDGCEAVITDAVGGCPNDAQTGVDGSISFQLDPGAETGPWSITLNIGYYDSGNTCSALSYSLSGSVLPVELTSFTANETREGVELDWTTVSEINNNYFTVERSKDSKNFEAIGEVSGAGDSYESINYHFVDNRLTELNSNIIYYRLKQMDFDGQFSYSEIVSVDLKESQSTLITNIISEGGLTKLHVSSSTNQEAEVVIYDLSGQFLKKELITLSKGNNELSIEHNIARAGIYFYSLISTDGMITKRFFH